MRFGSSRSTPVARIAGRAAVTAAFLATLVVGLVLPIRPLEASHYPLKHVKGTFPSHGFLWLDDVRAAYGSDSSVWVDSDRCKSAELSAWSRIGAQLPGGAAEFRGFWPTGIDFVRAACTSTAGAFTDVMLDYMTSSQWTAAGHGAYGGHHHHTLGDSSWCQMMGARYPCGYHISRLHINEPRFDGYTTAYKVGFLLHETGHSMGFYDYCGHTSVANNGMYCSLAGNWYSVDRKMLRDVVYKNSPVYMR